MKYSKNILMQFDTQYYFDLWCIWYSFVRSYVGANVWAERHTRLRIEKKLWNVLSVWLKLLTIHILSSRWRHTDNIVFWTFILSTFLQGVTNHPRFFSISWNGKSILEIIILHKCSTNNIKKLVNVKHDYEPYNTIY